MREPDRSKDSCRNHYRRSKMTMGDLRTSSGSECEALSLGHFFLLVILSLAITAPESLFKMNTRDY